MPLLSWLLPQFARLRNDDSGNFAIFTALCAVPLIVVACGSVDVIRMTSTQERLQVMLDSATLAAASLSNSGDMSDVVDDYMAANKPDGAAWNTLSYTTVEVTNALNSKEVEITAEVTLKTPFLSLIGRDTQTVTAISTAVQSQTEIEISLVLDISSSMRGAKLADLITASKEFIDLMLSDGRDSHTSINLVLFGGTVNLGDTLYKRYAVEASSAVTDPDSATYTVGAEVPSKSFLFTHGNTCIEYTDEDFDLDDIPEKSRPQVPNFTRYGAMNDWCPRSNTESIFNSNKADVLKARIDEMTLSDGTGMDIGTLWGAKALSPNMRGVLGGDFADRPVAFDDEDIMKIAVIMTDGGITDQTRPRDPTSSEKPHISNSSTRQTIVSKTNATAYFKSLCDVMKTQSIYVYTVGYQITSGSSEDTLMKYCAKSLSDYYHVEGFDLSSAFNGIAASINNLRISG